MAAHSCRLNLLSPTIRNQCHRRIVTRSWHSYINIYTVVSWILLQPFSAFRVGAASSFLTSLNSYQTTRCHNPENVSINFKCRENLKFRRDLVGLCLRGTGYDVLLVSVTWGVELWHQHQFVCLLIDWLVSYMVTSSPFNCIKRIHTTVGQDQAYVAYKLLTTERTLIMISPISGEFVGERFRQFFLELKQNFCGHRFKDDHEV